MKALLINGSPHKHGCTYTALKEVSDTLNIEGIETEIFHIGTGAVRSCIACMACTNKAKGGCIFDDDRVNDAIKLVQEADALVVGSPVHYAGPAGSLNAFLDRMFFMKKDIYALKPAAAVVSCRRGGASATFDRLNKYFTISSMPIVSSQYWNSVHGNTPEEVAKDLEGLQTMRTLARNMAWLLKSIEAGKNAGLPLPTVEERVGTNFIR